VKRFPFLDWTRGLAVVIMIECHVFNSFARPELRQGGPYILSQFIGGMAAVLFLFMTGMTLAFQMDGLDRREPSPLRRWTGALRRGAYVLGIAYAFRLTNYLAGLPGSHWSEIVKVDILNCMGAGMCVFAVLAMIRPARRAQLAAALGLVIAAAAPLVSGLDWGSAPFLLRDYLQPHFGRFPLFPWTAYLAFGLAAGTVLKRSAPDRLERLIEWGALTGIPMIFGAWYFANVPFSLYARSEFWLNSPMLVLIRTGVILLMLAAAYLWTEYGAGGGWSWMLALGKTSLLVYWVHVMLVYGDIAHPFKAALSIPQTAAAAVAVVALMVALAAARLWWKARGTPKVRAAAA
jgi:uncharacterized membrane protein